MNKNNVLFSILFVASVGLAFATHAQQRWSHIGLISDTQANRLCAANVDGGVDFQCYQPNPEILSGGIISATGISVSGVISTSELWVNGVSITASGGSLISGLDNIGDVSATSPAANSLLRYNSSNSKWEAVGLNDGISTTSMVPGWPDAIMCNNGATDVILHANSRASTLFYYSEAYDGSATRRYLAFNYPAGTYATHINWSSLDCVTSAKSIATLYSEGKAFNFLGNNGAQISLTEIRDVSATAPSDGEALVWNDAQNRWIPGSAGATAAGSAGQIQFQGAAADLSASNSFTWDNTNDVLGVIGTISSTYIQLPSATTVTTCDSGAAGTMRYSDDSGAMQYCNGSAWANIGVGVPAGTIAAFTTSCPAGWSVLSDSAGRFLRGLDTTGTIDPAGAGRSLGDTQDDQLESHTHNMAVGPDTAAWAAPNFVASYRYQAAAPTTLGSSAAGGDETRPKNVAVNFCEYTGMGSVAAGGATDGSAGSPSLMFTNDTDTGWWRPAANTMAASTGGTERMRIDSAGNVGIGTNNPQTDLEVAGTISATAIGAKFTTVSAASSAVTGYKSVTASCPANYTMVSGGCAAVCCQGWLISSNPSGNGWSCGATDSYGTGYAITAYARCMKTSN